MCVSLPRPAPHPPPPQSRARNVPSTDRQRSRGWWSQQGKKALFFGGSTPFLWASTKEMGSNRRASHRPPPNVSSHTHNPPTSTKPSPKSGEERPDYRLVALTRMVEPPGQKSAFLWRLDTVSLGKHQRNGVESQDRPSTTAQRIGAHAETRRPPPAPSPSRARNVPSTDL